MLKKMYKILILSSIFSICLFEISHLHAHEHECEHIILENQTSQDLVHTDSSHNVEESKHEHDGHEHLVLIAKVERQNNTSNLVAPINNNVNCSNSHITPLNFYNHCRLLSARRYIKEHSFLYKNPHQFRNRFLLI